jgi:hypothetical protein
VIDVDLKPIWDTIRSRFATGVGEEAIPQTSPPATIRAANVGPQKSVSRILSKPALPVIVQPAPEPIGSRDDAGRARAMPAGRMVGETGTSVTGHQMQADFT